MTLVIAKYFQKKQNNNVQCLLCPNNCVLENGEYGKCLSRKNIDGILYSEAYCNLCAVNIDPVEKKPLFHFLPGTHTLSIAFGGCNLKCLNCQNYSISQAKPIEVQQYNYSPSEIVNIAIEKKIKSISYTYTEPLISYEYTYNTAIIAKQNHIKNILVTAGYVNKQPLVDLLPLIDAVNIDIKSFSNETYSKINRAKLNIVLDTILLLKQSNIWIEITYLLIPTINDSKQMISELTYWLLKNNLEKVPIHISKFFPSYKLINVNSTKDESIINVIEFLKNKGFLYVYSGNMRSNQFENTICPNCKRVIIKRNGYSINEFHITNNKCNFCDTLIQGVFN